MKDSSPLASDYRPLAKALLISLAGKPPKTVAQLIRLKAIKSITTDKDVVKQVADELVESNQLTREDSRSPKYRLYQRPQPTVEELLEAKLAPIEKKLDRILAILSGQSDLSMELRRDLQGEPSKALPETLPEALPEALPEVLPEVTAGELLAAIDKVDKENNCHNLVPLPLLFSRLRKGLSKAQFHALLLSLFQDEKVDLQARSDRTSISPEEQALGIEDPYRGLLYYVGRKGH